MVEARVVDTGIVVVVMVVVVVVGGCVLGVDAREEEVLCDTLLHEALNPFSLTVPSDLSLINSELPVELIGPIILLEQNFPISGESRLLPSLMSTKSNSQAVPQFSK